ncbi:hypothetical protein DFH06DRAFT_1258851 [Mycena polygramma]|nr:hypothetical protein DFH06DRAFT_1258851 [Mycena polygramma]
MSTQIVVFDPKNPAHTALIPSFADIHIACNRNRPHHRDFHAAQGARVIFMALVGDADGPAQLAGYVVLYRPLTETGPGLARKLMEKLERTQRSSTLDTETGSPAEIIYPRLGYTQLGIIPKYGVSPVDGSLIAETFFWKQL